MSSFAGRMKEYSFISLDRFDGENLKSSIFLLSHCHQDHMIGLDKELFINTLSVNGYKLYCHSITAELLLNDSRYIGLKPFLEPLEIDTPHIIEDKSTKTKEPRSVVVTLCSAGHCPGSVMFLIEGAEGTVLYTGDIRLTLKELEKMAPLHNDFGVKEIQSLYFDSTFCVPEALNIPSRWESSDALIQVVKEWMREDEGNKILLYCAAKYGHEFLLVQLSKALNLRVHVSGSKLRVYQSIPSIAKAVTADPKESPIHACSFWDSDDAFAAKVNKDGKNKRKSLTKINSSCPECSSYDPKVLVIKPSMMWFSQMLSIKEIAYHDPHGFGDRLVRVQYSSHSSLREIQDLVKYLQPEKLFPNVVPKGSTKLKVIDRVSRYSDKIEHPSSPDEFFIPAKRARKKRSNFKPVTLATRQERFDKLGIPRDKPEPRRKKKKQTGAKQATPGLWVCPKLDSSDSEAGEGNEVLKNVASTSNTETDYPSSPVSDLDLRLPPSPDLLDAETLDLTDMQEDYEGTLDLTHSSSNEVEILD